MGLAAPTDVDDALPCPACTVGPSGPSSVGKGSDGKDNPRFHAGIAGRAEDLAGSAKGLGGAGAEATRVQRAWQGVLQPTAPCAPPARGPVTCKPCRYCPYEQHCEASMPRGTTHFRPRSLPLLDFGYHTSSGEPSSPAFTTLPDFTKHHSRAKHAGSPGKGWDAGISSVNQDKCCATANTVVHNRGSLLPSLCGLLLVSGCVKQGRKAWPCLR